MSIASIGRPLTPHSAGAIFKITATHTNLRSVHSENRINFQKLVNETLNRAFHITEKSHLIESSLDQLQKSMSIEEASSITTFLESLLASLPEDLESYKCLTKSITRIASHRFVQALVDYPTIQDLPPAKNAHDYLDLASLRQKEKPSAFATHPDDLCELPKTISRAHTTVTHAQHVLSSAICSLAFAIKNRPPRVLLPTAVIAVLKCLLTDKMKTIEEIARTTFATLLKVQIGENLYVVKLIKSDVSYVEGRAGYLKIIESECLITMGMTINPYPNLLQSLGFIDSAALNRSAGTTGYSRHAILMPYYPNGDLCDQIVKRREPLTRAKTKTLLLGLSKAIRHLHSHQLIHADIKPENVLLDGDTPILGDFGLAHADTLIRTYGTKQYLPPECFIARLSVEDFPHRRDIINTAIDIWSLGVLAYALITRNTFIPIASATNFWIESLPRCKENPQSLIDAILDRTLKEMEAEPTERLDEFWDVIRGCLKFFPAERPNIDEVVSAFEKIDIKDSTL